MPAPADFKPFNVEHLVALGIIAFLCGLIGWSAKWFSRAQADNLGRFLGVSLLAYVVVVYLQRAAAGELRWGERYGVSVIGLQREDRTIWGPVNRHLRVGDLLYTQGSPTDLLELAQKEQLATPAQLGDVALELNAAEARLAEVLVAPNSALAGRTLREIRFQQRFDATVLAVQHQGRTLRERLALERIEAGDLMLVHGETAALQALADTPGFVLLGEVARPLASRPRALVSVLILVGVVVLAGLEIVPILTAALAGVVLMIFLNCVTLLAFAAPT